MLRSIRRFYMRQAQMKSMVLHYQLQKKLVERIGIYFPEKVEKQKSKKQNEQKLKVMLLSLRRKWKDGDQRGNHIKVH